MIMIVYYLSRPVKVQLRACGEIKNRVPFESPGRSGATRAAAVLGDDFASVLVRDGWVPARDPERGRKRRDATP